jgi:hypothetical protein
VQSGRKLLASQDSDLHTDRNESSGLSVYLHAPSTVSLTVMSGPTANCAVASNTAAMQPTALLLLPDPEDGSVTSDNFQQSTHNCSLPRRGHMNMCSHCGFLTSDESVQNRT